MRKFGLVSLLGLVLLALCLVGCEGYTQTGSRSTEHRSTTGGELTVQASKANGSVSQGIEFEDGEGLILEADVALTVGKGVYKIELLGENDQVTLTLEARDSETVSGHGYMVVDTFDEANYRVTATEAEDVEYTITYTYR